MERMYQNVIDNLDVKALEALDWAKDSKYLQHVGSDSILLDDVAEIFTIITGAPVDAFKEFFGQSFRHPEKTEQ